MRTSLCILANRELNQRFEELQEKESQYAMLELGF